MASNLRVPPRFVPTLTAVLEVPTEPAAAVPTKTLASSAEFKGVGSVTIPPQSFSSADAFRLEEDLLHRVLQRVDFRLEARLSDAVSAAVQQQLDAMLPRLREKIESVLRSLVVEALTEELSENTGSVPASASESLG